MVVAPMVVRSPTQQPRDDRIIYGSSIARIIQPPFRSRRSGRKTTPAATPVGTRLFSHALARRRNGGPWRVLIPHLRHRLPELLGAQRPEANPLIHRRASAVAGGDVEKAPAPTTHFRWNRRCHSGRSSHWRLAPRLRRALRTLAILAIARPWDLVVL